MLRLLLALLVLAAVSCGVRPQAGVPGPTVQVLQEGIHSGLVIPADWVWPGAAGVTEFSFGDRVWMMNENRGAGRASRLVLWSSDGAVFLKAAADAAHILDREGVSGLAVPLSPTGAAQMQAELARWLRPGPDLATWTDGSIFRPAVRFHVFHNCHDQVAAALRAAGVPVPPSWLPWRSAGRFRADVETALAELAAAGIAYVENGSN